MTEPILISSTGPVALLEVAVIDGTSQRVHITIDGRDVYCSSVVVHGVCEPPPVDQNVSWDKLEPGSVDLDADASHPELIASDIADDATDGQVRDVFDSWLAAHPEEKLACKT